MIAIITILVVAGLVWFTVYARRGSMLGGCLAFLFVGYCLSRFMLGFQVGPFPLTLDRIMLGGLMIAFVVKWRLGQTSSQPLGWIEKAMLALAAVLTISTFTHGWQVDGPDKVSPIWLLVAGYLMPMALYFMVRQTRFTQRQVGWVYGFLSIFGLYLAVTAIAEVTGQWWLVFPNYVSDAEMGIHFGRARGPGLQSQSLGFHLVVCLLAAWFWRQRFGRPGQLVMVLIYGVFLTAIALTFTRCVWMGMALGGLIVLGLSLRGQWRPLMLGSALALGLAVPVLFWNSVVNIERDSGSTASRSSVQVRTVFTYVSYQMFLDRPILGAGFGQFPEAVKPYLSDRSTSMHLEEIRNSSHHNTFLSLLTETGLLGMGLFVAILIGWGRQGWRMWRSTTAPRWVRTQGLATLGLLGVYVCPAMFFDLAYSPQDHSLLFLFAAVTAGLRPWITPAKEPVTAQAPEMPGLAVAAR